MKQNWLENKIEQAKLEEVEEAKEIIEKSIKNRAKGVITLFSKEVDFDGQRITFSISEAEIQRRETALSFATIRELYELIEKGEKEE